MKEKKSKEEKEKIKMAKKQEKENKKQNKKESKPDKENKKKNKENKDKEKKSNGFIQAIKKKWLINGTKTIILVLVLIAVFLTVNMVMHNLNLAPLDFTQEGLYTLTDESKEKVKDIDKDVNIYFIGYTDENSNLDLAKQYHNANERINAEAIDINNRPDLAQKYGIESGTQGIIVECGDRSQVLTESDLYTYDTSTYEQISIAEEKLTSAILSVTTDKVPKVYFLEGYSNFSLTKNMYYLSMYLSNEVNEIDTLDVLSTGSVPDDCDTLVITTPSKDFDDVATKAITDYINRGGNILWLNAAVATQEDFPNVNSILALYGIDPFSVGRIVETDTSKMVLNSPYVIVPELQYSEITKNIYTSTGPIFINATKININEDKLEEQKVKETELATTSDKSYFQADLTGNTEISDEEQGSFVVGAELDKTIKEANEETGESEVTSKLVIYGENIFASDEQVVSNSQYPALQLGYNRDLVLNSIAYLVDRPEDITARKDTGTVTYTATQEQDLIIRIVIFAVPLLIVLAGIIVWQVRRRKK